MNPMILTSIPSMRILLNAVTGMADIVCQMLLSHQFCYNHVFSFFYVSNFITKIDLPADERSYISKRTENETTLSYCNIILFLYFSRFYLQERKEGEE